MMRGKMTAIYAEPRLKIQFESGLYTVKTADTEAELIQAFQLRHEVFHREMAGSPLPSGIDTDRFDLLCDHLIVLTHDTKQVVATYRLNPSPTADCYSHNEFKMDNVLCLSGRKLEIGRACVACGHRGKKVFAILFKGLSDYIKQSETRYVFGCSSVHINNLTELKSLCGYFHSCYFAPENLRVYPLPSENFLFDLNESGHFLSDEKIRDFIPPVLKFYIRGGAKLCGEPYYDSEFNVYDFFTLLDVTAASPVMKKALMSVPDVSTAEKAGGV
jgi:putative hemolysin